jgi:predicted MFS family arabinose efflux permease
MGIGLAARSVLQAYTTSASGSQSRILGLAGINGAYGLAFIIGPAIAIFALDDSEVSYQLIAWIACAFSVAAFLLAMIALKPHAASRSDKPEVQAPPAAYAPYWPPRPAGMAAIGLQAVLSFVFATMAATVGVWSAQVLAWDARHLALAFGCAGIAAVATQFGAAHAVIRRYGDHAAAAFAGGLMVAGLILLVLWPRAEATLAAMALLGAGSATALTSLQYLSSRMNRRRAQGTLFGLSLSLNSAARVLGPVWGGFSLVHIGLSAPYISGAILALVASLMVIHLARRSEEQYP